MGSDEGSVPRSLRQALVGHDRLFVDNSQTQSGSTELNSTSDNRVFLSKAAKSPSEIELSWHTCQMQPLRPVQRRPQSLEPLGHKHPIRMWVQLASEDPEPWGHVTYIWDRRDPKNPPSLKTHSTSQDTTTYFHQIKSLNLFFIFSSTNCFVVIFSRQVQ